MISLGYFGWFPKAHKMLGTALRYYARLERYDYGGTRQVAVQFSESVERQVVASGRIGTQHAAATDRVPRN